MVGMIRAAKDALEGAIKARVPTVTIVRSATLGLAAVEIISPGRDAQAGEASVIIATITVSKAGQ
jgi:hypothetical protein